MFMFLKLGNFLVEIDGDWFYNLYVFINVLVIDVFDVNDLDVIYFKLGIYIFLCNVFDVLFGKIVYFVGGVVVKVVICCCSVENVCICGCGLFY